MENNIRFKKGDWVCLKECIASPFSGVYINDVKDIRPWVVLEVLPDRDWENRMGESGCANEYKLGDYVTNKYCAKRYQYELQPWTLIKERVIKKLEEELGILKEI